MQKVSACQPVWLCLQRILAGDYRSPPRPKLVTTCIEPVGRAASQAACLFSQVTWNTHTLYRVRTGTAAGYSTTHPSWCWLGKCQKTRCAQKFLSPCESGGSLVLEHEQDYKHIKQRSAKFPRRPTLRRVGAHIANQYTDRPRAS